MTIVNQRDERWANLKLGKTSLTVGRYGCTISSICAGLGYFGFDISPKVLAAQDSYTDKNYKDGEGLILWNKVILPGGFRMRSRIHGRNDDAIIASLKNPNEFVILEVDNSHWVLALSTFGVNKLPLVNDYRMMDPWYGDNVWRTGARYKRITGSAHFTRK